MKFDFFLSSHSHIYTTIILILYQIYLHTVLCFQLTFKLINFLSRGTKTWIFMLGRLLGFVILLTPGWFNLMKFWLFDDNVIRNIAYSNTKVTGRNFLDIYLPPQSLKLQDSNNKYPVVMFVSGGAWVIGQ